jgi:hypothetical protein
MALTVVVLEIKYNFLPKLNDKRSQCKLYVTVIEAKIGNF